MGLPDRYAGVITRYSRVVVVVMLVATLLVGSGAANVESGINIASFASDSTAAEKLDYVQANFTSEGENTTSVQVVFRGEGALSRDALLTELRIQEAMRANRTVNRTLAEPAFAGLSNVVATAAIREGRGGNDTANASAVAGQNPSLAAQIDQLESMSEDDVDRVLERVLAPDAQTAGVDPYTLLPTDYEPGSTEADARVLFVSQRSVGDDLSQRVIDGQLAIRDIVDEQYDRPGEAFAFGAGIVDAESTAATGDSFAVISPFALLLMVTVLLYVYRDPLDVLFALVGVVLVLVWMGGFMGWTGIGVTQIIIAVPFLLIGLSVDYALHVVMRYREARDDSEQGDDRETQDESESPVRSGMRRGLGGVVVALGATTFTTAVGFLANYTSPIGSIQEFGLVSAAGIVAAFLVFVALLPALKLELDGLLERVGFDRSGRAFGRAGAANRALSVGTTAARVAPVAVIVVGLLLAGAGGYAATDVETSIDQVDFLPQDPPAWMDSLPGGLAPGDYQVREAAIYLNDNFLQSRERTQVEILVEGDVADPGTLGRVAAGRRAIANQSSAITLADGEPRVTDPLSVMRSVARENESFNATFGAADTDDDGVPDRNVREVYGALFAAAPDRAGQVLYREGGEYRALRMQVVVQAGTDTATVTREMRDVAATIEEGTDLTVTATGQPVVQEITQNGLLRTLVQGFLLTLGVILAFLTLIFYRRHGTLTLGAVTLVPVVVALAWILGTMYLLGIPFNTETAIITSIAIGLGVDYAIHVSERFVEELSGDPFAALDRTLSGTGGALLASATTTAGGFGVLTLALVPSLQRFGLVTGVTIVYAFVASVVLLPSLLVVWERRIAD